MQTEDAARRRLRRHFPHHFVNPLRGAQQVAPRSTIALPGRCRSSPLGEVAKTKSSREERVARNERLFQEVNRQIEKLEETLGRPKTLAMLCECSKKHCPDGFEVEPAVYQRVRLNPLLFFRVPSHEDPEVERVVERAAWRPARPIFSTIA